MVTIMGLDFETYSDVDIKKHGLDRYVSSPYFQPLLASCAYQDQYGVWQRNRFDFVEDPVNATFNLRQCLASATMVTAHNSPFERRVLDHLQLPIPKLIDSAVVARIAGGGSKLEAAAPQLVGSPKLDMGGNLIKLFSIPGLYQEANDSPAFDPQVVTDNPDKWLDFGHYCDVDAELSATIVRDYQHLLSAFEYEYQQVTDIMNETGWYVDVPTVEEMNRRYHENKIAAEENFRAITGATDLNLNSLPQLKAWCKERGIRSSSFNEERVTKLAQKIRAKVEAMPNDHPKKPGYTEVLYMLQTKVILGGSSLSKLNKILDLVGPGNRLRDQYLHCGAGQSLRTTGRGAQMQNLKRIGDEPATMETLMDDESDWDNDTLARNIRQVFTASEPNGQLIVGDFKSVESRGLAWAAGENWKLEAYRKGLDVYKAQAQQIFGIAYEAVSKEQRQTGKVGELSCGYGAGPDAVVDFAAGMGVELTHGEATKLVSDWRSANPETVEFWWRLEDMLHSVLEGQWDASISLPDGFTLTIAKMPTPQSLLKQHANAQSLVMRVMTGDGRVWMNRVFHGCYRTGRNVRYFKPSELKGGDLWRAGYTNPKTKQWQHYELYGGKLTGIFVQSFCRELFMQSLLKVHGWCMSKNNVQLVGQFHDEIVLDWRPGPAALRGSFDYPTLLESQHMLRTYMSSPGAVKSFPLDADIKNDYRYTK